MRCAFTAIELLVATAIVAALAGLVLPVVATARGMAQSAACRSNLRQVGIAVLAYATDHDDRLPADRQGEKEKPATTAAWFRRLPPYFERSDIGRSASVFQCPAYAYRPTGEFTNATPKSYKMNAQLPRHHRLGTWSDEHRICLFADATAKETGMGQWGHLTTGGVDGGRHRGKANLLCLDGATLATVRRAPQGEWDIRWYTVDE